RDSEWVGSERQQSRSAHHAPPCTRCDVSVAGVALDDALRGAPPDRNGSGLCLAPCGGSESFLESRPSVLQDRRSVRDDQARERKVEQAAERGPELAVIARFRLLAFRSPDGRRETPAPAGRSNDGI